MTVRLSQRSLTGTDRTLVAVGTDREASMFWAVRAGAPRRTVSCGSSLTSALAAGSGSLGTGAVVLGVALAGVSSARGLAAAALFTCGAGAAGFSAPFASDFWALGWAGFGWAGFGAVFGAVCWVGVLAPFGPVGLSVTCSPGV